GGTAGRGAGRRRAFARAGQRARAARESTRGPRPVTPLLVRPLELAEEVVAAGHERVQGLLRRLLAGPHGLRLLVHHVPDLYEVAEADPLGVLGGRLVVHLADRRVGPGVLLVEPLLLRKLVGRQGDREVAGPLVRG